MKRVVVTGLGVISPIGKNVTTFFDSLINGKSGVRKVECFDPSDQKAQIAGEIVDFKPEEFIDKKLARKIDRYSQFAIAAAKQAFEDSGLQDTEFNRERAGVMVGSGVGGIIALEKGKDILSAKGPRRISPFLVPMLIPNMASGNVSIELDFQGVNISLCTACATGTHSIGEAFQYIKLGKMDIMAAGGSEAPITPLTLAGFAAAKALSVSNDNPQAASRPFDKMRDGFVMAEGSGILILEEYEHAKKRGAHIYGEICGYGATGDAFHMTAPHPEARGAINAMKIALAEAELDPEKVGYVNAHGTSTSLNDKYETMALKTIFKAHAEKLLISSNKSMIGHMLGAAGAVEAIATLKTLETGKVPPTINLENPDPDCDLFYVPNTAVEADLKYAISNSFGFGGHNGVLVFKKA
ncbi:beta-ketoacyl-ACP synthase II [bacterium]|nr:beta-ketoacyl-ACP synthase II [bacterium]